MAIVSALFVGIFGRLLGYRRGAIAAAYRSTWLDPDCDGWAADVGGGGEVKKRSASEDTDRGAMFVLDRLEYPDQ